jgi:hypothetical protein
LSCSLPFGSLNPIKQRQECGAEFFSFTPV